MNKTTGFKALLALTLSAGWSVVFAASISLDPSELTIGTNETFSLDLVLDASDINNPDYSGQVLISYDPVYLTYVGFNVNSTDGVSIGTPVEGTSDNQNTVKLGFGFVAFNSGTIGTYTFMSNSITGPTNIDLDDGNDVGSFYANEDKFVPAPGGTSITVVPLPGALWLMLSGLGLLGLARRKA